MNAALMPATRKQWDEWLSLFASRNEVADEYAAWLLRGGTIIDFALFNAAILRRWSPAGFAYIKQRAWRTACAAVVREGTQQP